MKKILIQVSPRFVENSVTFKVFSVFIVSAVLQLQTLSAQVGIGTNTPHSSAMLEVQANDKGILIPRMTQAERSAIATPATGLIVYQTDATSGLYYFDGTAWVQGVGPQGIQGPVGATGATGPAGPTGATGATGPAGAAGVDGKTVLNGTSNPAPGTGVDGDFYINTSTNTLFGPKAGGSWPAGVSLVGPQGATGATGPAGPTGATGATGPAGAVGATGPAGAAGADGKTVLNGTSNPTAGTGVNGDFYINTSTNTLFGPKTGGSWPSGVSLVGPQGATGATGSAGATGATGATGPAGPAPSGTGIVTVNNGTLQTPAALTGDVTTSGSGLATTIATGAVTSSKILDATITNADIANSTIDLTAKVTGTLPVANGGTGINTLTANNLLAGNGTAAVNLIAPGSSGNVLVSNGTSWSSGNTNNYIQNQNGSDQSAGFRINGNGLIGGSIGIGNTSPPEKLVIGTGMAFHDGGDKVIGFGFSPATGITIAPSGSYPAEIRYNPIGNIQFGTAPAPSNTGSSAGVERRMTINRDGNVGIGTTSPGVPLDISTAAQVSLRITSTTNDNQGMITLNGNTGNSWGSNWHDFISFQRQGTLVGSVTNNGLNNVNYNTTSDYRLKKDFKDFNGLNLLSQMKVYDYSWQNEESRMFGFKAHELQEVIPYLVTGEKDAVDAEGKPKYQMVDYGKLTPVLAKAIQEQQEMITKQQEKIEKLEKLVQMLLNQNK